MNPLKQLESCGQSPWLDDLHKTLITSGELKGLIEKQGLKGLTSNPSIFENTMPPATMKAFDDHGTAAKDTIEHDVEGAEASLAALEQLGISLDEITHELVLDGVKKFEEAFDNLIGGVKKRRGEFSKAA